MISRYFEPVSQGIYEDVPNLLRDGGNNPFGGNNLYSGAHESDYIRNAPLISEMDPVVSRAPNPGLITEEEPDAPKGLIAQPKPATRGQVPRASGIRKDGFFSFFNPANWFKWGKEKKLARQAAKAIADPSSAPKFKMTAAHTKALNTTHGQKILKAAAKDGLKADNDPLSKMNYRRAEGKREEAHVGENSHRKAVNPITQEQKRKHYLYGTQYEGPEPDIAQIMQTFQPQSYEEWKASDDAEWSKQLAAKDKSNQKLAGSSWGKRHAQAFREAYRADHDGADPGRKMFAAAREKHQANRDARSLLKDNRDLPPIMREMWGERSKAVKASNQWRTAMEPKVEALNLGAALPWGNAFKGTAFGFNFEEDGIKDAPQEPSGDANHKSYESLRESGAKGGRAQDSIDIDDEAEVEQQQAIKLQRAIMNYQQSNKKPQNSMMIEEEKSDDEDFSNSFTGNQGMMGGFFAQKFILDQLHGDNDDDD